MQAIDDRLGYDADHDDPRQYCPHGTWIGSWWGPDYMCYWCETGETPPTPYQEASARFAKRLRLAKEDMLCFDGLTRQFTKHPYNARFAQALVDCVTDEYWAKAIWYYKRSEVFR